MIILGHEVHIITVSVEGSPNYELVDGIQVHRVAVSYDREFFNWVRNMNLAMHIYLVKLITESATPFDLLHAHDWLVADAAIAIVNKFQIPLIATIHATESGRNNGIHNDTQRYIHSQEVWLTQIAQKVIVCTNYMRLEVIRILKCPELKIAVVFNGLSKERLSKFQNLNFDQPQLRHQFAQPNEKIVYYVGRITHEKGVFVLINAAPRVINSLNSQVKFIIIGSGDLDPLKRQAWNLGIAHKVLFTGFMADQELIKFQTIADCAVFPSLYEPFGIVALESFAAQVPVVVSNAGGLPEVVSDGETGIVTQANNSESLANGIIKILKNSDYARQLAAAALHTLQARFAWEPLAVQTIAIYQTLLADSLLAEN